MNMLNDHKMTIKFLLIGFMMMFAVKGEFTDDVSKLCNRTQDETDKD